MRTSLIVLSLVLMSMSSCSSRQKQESRRDLASLEEAASLLIPLDTLTTQASPYFQLINDSTLAFLNKPNFDICIVNLNSLTTEKIQLHREGPHNVAGIDAFCYVSPDSIWLFASWGRNMILTNSKGEVLQKAQIPYTLKNGDTPPFSVMPYAVTTTPYIVKGSKHYLQGMGGDLAEGQKPGVSLSYDIATEDLSTGNPYPHLYGTPEELDKWNTFGYRLAFYTFTPNGEMLTSFAASDSIYLYNPETGRQTSFYAGFSKPTNIRHGDTSSAEKKFQNFLNQYQYCAILYDATNEVYYRIVRLPSENYDSTNLREEITKKPNAVIILDKDLSVIGETILPKDSYYTLHAFVNSNGLHLNAISDDDDFMKFRVFKLKLKE